MKGNGVASKLREKSNQEQPGRQEKADRYRDIFMSVTGFANATAPQASNSFGQAEASRPHRLRLTRSTLAQGRLRRHYSTRAHAS